ncbi:hypothetical protein Ccrd_007033 [Cynara cardunculus var. scolymus]|uniref:C2H2-type domain-containing protein n=1 Tax=Cynara cardunculus var. scolymus TaxID=59895 RepID=A0A103XHK7_CYNCS|nr:hypothetical protein Ccrd_007033 [Cynara cardunculus var. scolymus]
MDVQDQTTHVAIPSGNEHHGVHLCHRCGWAFPNPHPSARHRRAHKKICGTIEGYTNLIDSGVVSDDEHHLDDDKEKTPSPVIEKRIGGRSSRSEEDLFSDAVTEFSDSVEDRSVVYQDSNKTLDRDLFFSFKDAEHGGEHLFLSYSSYRNVGANEVLNAPIEISKVDASLTISENLDTHVEKNGETKITTICDSTEAKLESQPLDAESIDLVEKRVEKVQESQASETDEHAVPLTVTEEAKDAGFQASELSKTTPEVSEVANGEKLKPETVGGTDCEHISGVVEESGMDQRTNGISEEMKHEKLESDHEHASEVVKESETDQSAEGVGEEIKKLESDYEHPSEVVKEPETDESKHEKLESDHEHRSEKSSKEHTHEVVEEPDSVLAEKEDLGATILEKSSKEHTHEVVEQPDSVLTKKEDLVAPIFEKSTNEHTHEVVEQPDSVLAEKEDLGARILEKTSEEHTHEVIEQPDSVLAEKEDIGAPILENSSKEHTHEVVEQLDSVMAEKRDLGAPILEKSSKEHTHEVVEEPDSVLTEKEDLGAPNSEKREVVEGLDSVLTEKKDLGAPNSEKCSKEHTKEVIKETKLDNDGKTASGVVSEHIVEEGNSKLMPNQDSGVDFSVDSSSRNSLEGNWGSVSVLSTASIDAEASHSTDKSKVNSGKLVAADSHLGSSDVFEPPSFMTLVEPKVDDQKPATGSQDSEQQSEASQAGWFPTLTNVSNESDGRKRNEEVIAKVTNWSSSTPTTATGKYSTPLKNLLGEAKSPNAKQPPPPAAATVVEKDEAATVVEKDEAPAAAAAVMSPPKLIDDGKNARKKVKGRGSWMPFVCCSSVNVVN